MSIHATETSARQGGCYCGALRYTITQTLGVEGQCHCRACQHVAGGGPQFFLLVPPEAVTWSGAAPKSFKRRDLETAVTRFFCETCGTHILTQRQDQAALVLKVGTLDDPQAFSPRVAICHEDAQPFHTVAEGIAIYDGIPKRG